MPSLSSLSLANAGAPIPRDSLVKELNAICMACQLSIVGTFCIHDAVQKALQAAVKNAATALPTYLARFSCK